jgi:hypothetical protein
VVGIIPLRTYVAGKFNMAGPVNELMAMAVDPNIPIEPMFHIVIVVDVYCLVRTKIEHEMTEMMAKK